MGIWETITDLVEAVSPFSEAEAEAPADEPEPEEEEEEEEEEDELEDPKEKFEEECRNSPKCAPPKHEFEACVERVNAQIAETGGPKEDCVEEFFELAHCATHCAAPKLWSVLK